MPRYVVLEHDYPMLHWDFMLEAGAALRTWRLSTPPAPGTSCDATALPDHRLAYLDYEGPVSGNRGRVVRWDHGSFTWLTEEAGRVAIRLDGERLSGTFYLERHSGDDWRGQFGAGQGG